MSWWNKTNPKQTSSSTTPCGGGSLRISIGGLDNKYHTPLYILITITLFTILSIIILSIRFVLTGAVGNEGNATLTNVSIKQAGTGQSVTIDNVTMDETAYGTNESRRTILNNNVVRYSATYSITAPGVIELSIALPANNTIDEATIGSAQGCITGSKLEKATVDGEISYTNNKATCIKNVSSGTTNTTWDITAYPWGSNNEQITPTLAINDQAQDTKPDPITVIGKPNYGILISKTSYNSHYEAGYNLMAAIDLSLYVPQSSTGVLGVSPINQYTVSMNMTNMPADTSVYICGSRQSMDHGVTSGFAYSYADYKATCQFSDDSGVLILTIDNIVTSTLNYSTYPTTSDIQGFVYVTNGIRFAVPTDSLSSTAQSYLITFDRIVGGAGGEINSSITPNLSQLSYSLSKAASGSVSVWHNLYSSGRGWESAYDPFGPVYIGENIHLTAMVTSRVLENNYTTNLTGCIAWNNDIYRLDDIIVSLSGLNIEYGVIGDVSSGNIASKCGKLGDSLLNDTFFNSLDEAGEYADSRGTGINAIRYRRNQLNNITNAEVLKPKVVVANETGDRRVFHLAQSDDWGPTINSRFSTVLTPGLLSHTITAIPSSTAPNTEDHITITTKTYNKDTNSKITTNLPNGLIPKAGSFTITNKEGNKLSLIEGDNQDYTLSSGCYANSSSSTSTTSPSTSSSTSTTSDGCTITFNLDHIVTNTGIPITGYDPILPGQTGTTNGSNTITNPSLDNGGDGLPIAADNDGNGITHTNTPIEFDVVVDKDTPTPSTLTINSTTSGTGTNYASSTFKEAKASVLVAEEQSFGYNLTSNATSLNIGDDLSYTYSTSNLSNTDITNLDAITVLPFNNDSRGTNGLIENSNLVDPTNQSITANNPGYLVRDVILTKSSTSQSQADTSTIPNPTIYFTVDNLARELEQTNPAGLATNNEINWVQCQLEERSDGSLYCANLPTNAVISALRWSMDTVPQGTRYFINLTLAGIDADNDSIIANNISYLQTDNFGTNTNLLTTRTTYDGETLSLDLDKNLLQVAIDPDSVMVGGDSLANILTAITSTKRGYHLTMNVAGATNDLTGQTNPVNRIPAISSKPTNGTKGWAVSLDDQGTWQAIPTGANPLTIKQMTIKGQDNFTKDIAYGISTSQSTIADTYRAGIVYTLTVEP